MKLLLLQLLVVMFAYPATTAEIYNYTDEEGNTKYTNVPTKNMPYSGNKESTSEFGEDVQIIERQKTESNQIKLQNKQDIAILDKLQLDLDLTENKILSILEEIDDIKSSIPSSSMQALDYLSFNRFHYSECLRILEDNTYITNYQFYPNFYWGVSGTSITYPVVDPDTKVYCKQLIQDRKEREALFEQGNARINALKSQYDELIIYKEALLEQIRKYR